MLLARLPFLKLLFLLVLLRPHNGSIKQRIDGAELVAVAELQPRYERLARAPEQFQRPRIELQFAVQRLTVGSAPDTQTTAGRADLHVGVAGLVEQALCPGLDGAGDRIPHVVNVDSGKRVLRPQHVGNSVTGGGCCYRGFIRAPAARIGGAGKPMRIIAAKGRLGPTTCAPNQPPISPTADAHAVVPARAAGLRNRPAVW